MADFGPCMARSRQVECPTALRLPLDARRAAGRVWLYRLSTRYRPRRALRASWCQRLRGRGPEQADDSPSWVSAWEILHASMVCNHGWCWRWMSRGERNTPRRATANQRFSVNSACACNSKPVPDATRGAFMRLEVPAACAWRPCV